MGLLVGNVIDRVDAFRHVTNRPEVARLVDGSAVNLMVIGDAGTTAEIADVALARERRVVVRLGEADVEELQHELRATDSSFGLSRGE